MAKRNSTPRNKRKSFTRRLAETRVNSNRKYVKDPRQLNVSGSCCYNGVCEDNVTYLECEQKNKGSKNYWNQQKCKGRITRGDDLCCVTCGLKSNDPIVRKKLKNIKESKTLFRSRINENRKNIMSSDNSKCKNSCGRQYQTLINMIKSHKNSPQIVKNELHDIASLYKIFGNENCETCMKRNDYQLSHTLRSYNSCLCDLSKKKSEEIISIFETYSGSYSGKEQTQDDLEIHKKIDEMIEDHRESDEYCSSIIENDRNLDSLNEKKIGCCCQYIKSFKSDGTYKSGDLRRCSSKTKRQCDRIRKYQTSWKNCSDCGKECGQENRPGTCSACTSSYKVRSENGPFVLNGYYPLYDTAQGAIDASPTPGKSRSESERVEGLIGYHTHVLNEITYYMPNGLEMGVTQFHGDYVEPKDDPSIKRSKDLSSPSERTRRRRSTPSAPSSSPSSAPSSSPSSSPSYRGMGSGGGSSSGGGGGGGSNTYGGGY